MLKQETIQRATQESRTSEFPIVVVHDKIAQAEEEGDYGYCPSFMVNRLFAHGTVIGRAINGTYTEDEKVKTT